MSSNSFYHCFMLTAFKHIHTILLYIASRKGWTCPLQGSLVEITRLPSQTRTWIVQQTCANSESWRWKHQGKQVPHEKTYTCMHPPYICIIWIYNIWYNILPEPQKSTSINLRMIHHPELSAVLGKLVRSRDLKTEAKKASFTPLFGKVQSLVLRVSTHKTQLRSRETRNPSKNPSAPTVKTGLVNVI